MRFRLLSFLTASALAALLTVGYASAQEAISFINVEPRLGPATTTANHTFPIGDEARALERKTSASPFGESLKAISNAALTEIRGGFLTDTGVKISFGIERAVFINGELVTSTRFGVSQFQPSANGVTADAGRTMTLVQNGGGNQFLPGQTGSTSAGTVVQNTLNNQSIRTVTVIDASLNSLEMLRSINLGANLRNSIANSLHR